MQKKEENKIDPHLNNLVFSLYNFAKSKIKSLSNNKQDIAAILPLDILRMLKKKIAENLTDDEEKLIISLISDLDISLKKSENKLETISSLDSQLEALENLKNAPYKITSIVEEAYSTVDIGKTSVQVILGDITNLPVEAIVSPDTTDLWMEQGLASIIRLKGGESIRREARLAGSIRVGDVVSSTAGEMSQKYIFHAAIMFPERESKKETNRKYIQTALSNIFKISEEKQIKSIAIPTLGVATNKFPYDALAKTMMLCIFDYLLKKSDTCIDLIIISLFNKEAYVYFVEQLKIAAAANTLTMKSSKQPKQI
ncbi:MAG: macro domain-containing protein [bacterium]